MDFARLIKQSVSTEAACHRYGVEINNRGFACCPFHHEKTPSMKVYPKDKGFHCFGCGASGDVVKFVQMYFNVPFQEAIKKINLDFGLGFDIDGKPTRGMVQNAAKQEYLRKKEEQGKADEKTALDDEYFNLIDMLDAAKENVKTMRPKDSTEQPSAAFLISLALIDRLNFEIDYIEEKRAQTWNK